MSIFSINSIQQAFAGTYNGTKTGSVSDTTQGSGTFSDTISHQNGVATSDDLVTYANGNTQETKTSITQNADGSYDETIQKFVDGKAVKSVSLATSADGNSISSTIELYNAKGKVASTANEVISGNADGSESVTGTESYANGTTGSITGSLTQTGSALDDDISVTNAAGQTATYDWTYSKSGGTNTRSYTDTNFAGTTSSDSTSTTVTPANA